MDGLGLPPFHVNALVPPPSLPTQVWVAGKYGGPYLFEVVPITDLPHIKAPVVYIVTRREHAASGLGLLGLCLGVGGPNFFLRFGYVGESCWCCERHRSHHRRFDFDRFGADIALVRVVDDERERCEIEKDIRWFYDPPLNRE
jgi:hypothetical protein